MKTLNDSSRLPNRFRFLLLTLIASVFFCNGCQPIGSVDTVKSNMVDSSQIYQDYSVEADADQTRVSATFRVGGSTGTTISLISPSKILYNNSPIPVSPPANFIGTNSRIKGTDYQINVDNYPNTHKFVFTDSAGKAYENAISLPPLEIAAKTPLALYNAEPTIIPLSRPVAENESVTFAISASFGDQLPTKGNTVYLNPARNGIIVTPAYWQPKDLAAKTEISVMVFRREPLAQGTITGGTFYASYTSASAPINVNKSRPISPANSKAVNVKTVNTNSAKATNANVKTSVNSNTAANQSKLIDSNSTK